MLLGHIDLIDCHTVRGWAVDTGHPDAAVDIAVFVDGRLADLVHADQARDDLSDTAAVGTGMHGLIYSFDPPLTGDRDHDVVVRFVEGGKLLSQWRIARTSVSLASVSLASVSLDPPAAVPVTVFSALETSAGVTASVADNGPLVGFLDVCSRGRLVGWAAREDRPDEIVTISVFVDESEVAQVRCHVPRKDLAEAGGFGDGAHGFNYAFDPPLPTTVLLRVSVRFAATGAPLPNGEQWLSAIQTETKPAERQPGANPISSGDAALPSASVPSDSNAERGSKYVGRVDLVSREGVSGWAACLDEPDIPIDVIIFVNGQRIARIRCDQSRPELARMRVPGKAPHGFRFAFTSRLPDELEVRISIRFADSGATLSNGDVELPAASGEARLAPILVTAPGRSGTTMLMERLGRCNEVVVANSHPYEIRMLSYYATAYHILTSAADLNRSTHPDKLEGNGFFVGFNPFSDGGYKAVFQAKVRHAEFYSEFVPGEILSGFRNIIMEYYLQNKDDNGKNEATFFAEKNNNLDLIPRKFARTTFGRVKEIVLLRDPRDLYLSRLSYFKHVAPRTVLQEVRWACTQLREIYREATPDMIFVKYEDIIRGHAGEMRRLSDFLGFDFYSADTSLERKNRFTEHATSGSAALSVGRWREQMSPDEIDAFDESAAEFFQLFGYERSSKVMAAAELTSAAALPVMATPTKVTGAVQRPTTSRADLPVADPRRLPPEPAKPTSTP